jgi:hypothetical protein
MDVEVGQEVYVPDPDGNLVRGTVLAHGAPGDAEEVEIDGVVAERDVAIVRHEDGPSKGFEAKVPYELITETPRP